MHVGPLCSRHQLPLHQRHPISRAIAKRVVVEIVSRIVMQRPIDCRTVAEPDITARRILREEGEIVPAVDGGKLVRTFSPNTVPAAASARARRIGIVDDRRNPPLEFIVDAMPYIAAVPCASRPISVSS